MDDAAQSPPKPTVQQKVDALRLGAKWVREDGNHDRAASMERSADFLENPDLPPTVEERIERLEMWAKSALIAQNLTLYGLARLMGASPDDLRKAAGLLGPPRESPTDLAAYAVWEGEDIARSGFLRIADALETGEITQLNTAYLH